MVWNRVGDDSKQYPACAILSERDLSHVTSVVT